MTRERTPAAARLALAHQGGKLEAYRIAWHDVFARQPEDTVLLDTLDRRVEATERRIERLKEDL